MATIRKLRGRWQAQVRRRGMKPRAKSFGSKADAERWARYLETQVDRFGIAPDYKDPRDHDVRPILSVTPRPVEGTLVFLRREVTR